jgi:uncharacterized protein YhaN
MRRLLDRVDATTQYEGLSLDADLGGVGVRLGGEVRSFTQLSVGTQEQIAALFRLSIATHLGTPIVLDDHLTHTDPVRVRWFRDLLRAEAHRTQIVVLTCHPLDYLDEADLPEEGRPFRDRAAGLVRAVDLTQIIE